MENPVIYKNQPWECPSCKTKMERRVPVTPNSEPQPRKGTIFVCSTCSRPSVLGDSSLHPLTKQEFEALDQPTRKALLMTAQGVKQLVDSGGSWNPYSKQ